MKLEKRVDELEQRMDQNEKNIRYINRKADIIKDGLTNVESTFIDLKNKLDKIDSNSTQDQSYDIDLSKGTFSLKNPRLEFLLITAMLVLIGFIFKSLPL